MAKYHITEAGNPAPCKATTKACPRGGADEHYDSKQEALTGYEKKMELELLNIFETYPNASRADEEFKEKVKRARRIEDAVLKSDPRKTVVPVPRQKQVNHYDGRDHYPFYVHPDFRQALPDDDDFKEYILTVHLDETLDYLQQEATYVSYDEKTGVFDLSFPHHYEPLDPEYD